MFFFSHLSSGAAQFFSCFFSSPRPSVVYPGPSGHIFLYCTVPGSGHSSHREPQPRPMLQQHSDLVTLFLLVDDCWHMVCRTSVKQKPFLLSGGKNTKKKQKNQILLSRFTAVKPVAATRSALPISPVSLTDTFRSSGARLKSFVAVAAVTSHRVDTTSVLTDAGFGTALVQV